MPLTLHTFQMCPTITTSTSTSSSSYGHTTFYCSTPWIVRNAHGSECRSSRCLSFCQALYQGVRRADRPTPTSTSRMEEIRKCHEQDFYWIYMDSRSSVSQLIYLLNILF